MENAVNWFEITVTDLDRAARFYEEVLAIKLRRENFYGKPLVLFPAGDPGVGGALVGTDRGGKPGAGGSAVYLNANGKLDASIARVERAGGSIVTPRTEIGDAGSFAIIRDPDGNLVGLHAERQR